MAQYASQQPSNFKNRIENIAIVGAGGQVGKFIVDKLLEKGSFKITAISREGSTNTPAPGVHVKTVNYDNPSTIVTALKGQDALIITMAVTAPPQQSAVIIKAAAEAGVPWVLPNEFGTDGANEQVRSDTMIGIAKKNDRDLIEQLGVSSWVGIACSFWYEYSLSTPGFYGINIATKEVNYFGDGNQRINTSTWPQTGRAVAEVLSLPILPKDENDKSVTLSSYRNEFVYVSSFALTQREMFEAIKRATGTSDSDWKISSTPVKELFESSKAKVMAGDRTAFGLMLYSRMFFPDEPGHFEATHGLDNDKLGLPKEDLDEFTKEAVKLSDEGYFLTLMARFRGGGN
ncbi:putative oxidoreductase CipA [Lindgomyces ingoldianus]|uniref:Oxidoreductase CipA n=1 Tax=Lindgomyces ingoldianus TaxID=673940 RepID=A0ACB6QLM7_9PLEO|nr:putative oxidoreductase CipA [Lindgomyces ingoldianus]KAF2467777.1 putative oxidoreductase CipA [Lindgomyces ingoldianus]